MIPTDKHIQIQCHTCQKQEIIETQTYHYCSKECSKKYFTDYWKKRWLQRKTDPVAMAHVRRAKKRYYQKSKLTE